MEIKKFVVGLLSTNCYVVVGDNNEALVIDPGAVDKNLFDYVKDAGLNVKYIVNTHGHVDHIGGNSPLHDLTGAPICISKKDEAYLSKDPKSYVHFNPKFINSTADRYLQEGDELTFGGLTAKIIETPGHSLGGLCVILPGVVFVGDTLFNGSIGRTDLADGSFPTIIESIQQKLFLLPDETIVYPGHMSETTIGKEKRTNPFAGI